MAVVTMRELLDAGAHLGHQTSRWNPKMKRYILTERHGSYIIDLQQTLALIDQAYDFVKQTVAHGGNILFVGTKKQAQETIAQQATRVGMPYVNHRWLGGMLTNFATVSKRVDRMKELEAIDFDDVAGSGHTKKELLLLERELKKLQASLGGIRAMTRTPSAIWVVDTEKEHLAVDEAKKLGIPVIAILDTNADPDDAAYPMPGNDDAIRSVEVFTRVIADGVAAGLMERDTGRQSTDEQQIQTPGQPFQLDQSIQELVETVDGAYPGGVIIEIEKEAAGGYEVEVVHDQTLHELQVAADGAVVVEKTKTKDDDIAHSQGVTVPINIALSQALSLHPGAVLDQIELDTKHGALYWEVELKDAQGNDIELDLPADQ